MNFSNLKYFCDVVAQGSLKVAAEINFVSQPAISQGIKKLEQDTGLGLLDHRRNTVAITAEGKALYKVAQDLFQAIHNYQVDLSHMKGGGLGALSVAVSSSLVPVVLTSAIRKFEKKYPKILLSIKVAKTSEQLEMMNSGAIDLGICIDDGSLGIYPKSVLRKGHFSLVGVKGCPDRLLLTEARPETLFIKDSLLKQGKAIQEMKIESWSSIYQLVKNGFGRGLLPDFMFSKKEFQNYSEQLKLKKAAYEIIAFTNRRASKLATHFIQELGS